MGSDLRAAVILAAAVLTAWLLFFHTTFVVPDSSGTYAWGRSLLFDRDVDFRDELDRLGWIAGDERVRFHATTAVGRPGNPFGIGSGILWMPFLLLAEAALALVGGGPSPRGYSELHILAASTGTAIFGLWALLVSARVARRYAAPADALAAALAVGLGTPFLAYAVHLPTYAHVNAAFAAALALAAALRARASPSVAAWGLAGAAVGAAALVRGQGALLLAIPLALWLPRLRASGRRELLGAAAIVGGFTAVFSLQAVAWWRLYGAPQVPQGAGFLDLWHPRLLDVLMSPWHGLFPWAPVLLLAVPGLVLLARRDPALGAGIAMAVGGQVWLVASVPDWWGGFALGARRLVDTSPLLCVCVAVGVAGMRRRAPAWLVHGALALAGVWTLLLVLQVRTGAMSGFRAISWDDLLRGQAAALRSLPAYVWEQATTSRWLIHTLVHRDSPVQPRFDPASGWLIAATVGLCWALGLAAAWWLGRRAIPRVG